MEISCACTSADGLLSGFKWVFVSQVCTCGTVGATRDVQLQGGLVSKATGEILPLALAFSREQD